MALCILGGGLMQWPIGLLSDKDDRRTVLTIALFIGGAMAIVIATVGIMRPEYLLYIAFVYGAASFPLYALTVSHANDYVEADERVVISGTLLLIYGTGAIIGAVLAGPIMVELGVAGLFYLGLTQITHKRCYHGAYA